MIFLIIYLVIIKLQKEIIDLPIASVMNYLHLLIMTVVTGQWSRSLVTGD